MKAKVLIVEDDLALRRGLVDNFADLGYEVLAAADGEEGLERALSDGPDVLILDIMLPGVNGYEICQTVRREGLEYPIIMLTARGQEQDVVRGLELGADDYVTKPFRVRELLARVRAFLRRHRASDTAVFEFGPCRLDREAHVFTRDGQPVKLTAKEFQLLEFFLENPGKALTRTTIMNHVWGNAIIVTRRSVDRCVTTLRAKIEDDPRSPRFIRTIRDVGYRFDPDGGR